MDQPTLPLTGSWLGTFGNGCGIAGALLYSLLLLYLLATVVRGANLRPGDRDGAFGVRIGYVVLIPAAYLAVVPVCLAGAIASGRAIRKHARREARLGLALSLAAPGVVLAGYVAGYALLYGSRF